MVSSGLLTPHIFWGNLWAWATPDQQEQATVEDKTGPYRRLLWIIEMHWIETQLGTYPSSYFFCFSPQKTGTVHWKVSLRMEERLKPLPCHLGSPSMSQSSHSHKQMAWAAQTKAGDNIPSLSLPQIHTWNLAAASETCQVKGEELPTWVFYCLVRAVYCFTFTAADRPAVGNYMEAVKFWGLLSHQCSGN